MLNNDTNVLSSNKPYKTGSVLCLFGFYDNGLLDKNANILPIKPPDFYKEVELTNEMYNSLATALLNGQPSSLLASTNEVLFFVNVNTPFAAPSIRRDDYIIAYYHCMIDSNMYSFYDQTQNRIIIDAESSEQKVVTYTGNNPKVDKLQYMPFFAVGW